jgi:hypothetical protein
MGQEALQSFNLTPPLGLCRLHNTRLQPTDVPDALFHLIADQISFSSENAPVYVAGSPELLVQARFFAIHHE